jgi:hypothetical protein
MVLPDCKSRRVRESAKVTGKAMVSGDQSLQEPREPGGDGSGLLSLWEEQNYFCSVVDSVFFSVVVPSGLTVVSLVSVFFSVVDEPPAGGVTMTVSFFSAGGVWIVVSSFCSQEAKQRAARAAVIRIGAFMVLWSGFSDFNQLHR